MIIGKGRLGSSTHASLNLYKLSSVHGSLNYNLNSVHASPNVGLPIGIILQTSEDCMQVIYANGFLLFYVFLDYLNVRTIHNIFFTILG